MISLNYSDLLKKYDEILISTSRGFDTEYEFLETWVPNNDINQSISDLINSAIDYRTKEFKLILSETEVKSIKVENLKKKFLHKGSINLTKSELIFCAIKKNV